jgi:hypothetical protein
MSSDLPKPGTMLCYGPDFVAHVVPDTETEAAYLAQSKFQMLMLSTEELREDREGCLEYMGRHCDTPANMRGLRLALAYANAEIARRIGKVAPMVTTTTVGE